MNKGKKLLDLGEDSGSDTGTGSELKINANYAERYNKWRGSEELQKLKDRYGENPDEDDESSSSSSDEEEWSAEKEKDFFRTFALLKKKDPKIYDSEVFFFKDDTKEVGNAASSSTEKKKRKTKDEKVTLKDHERKMIMEKGTLESDAESDGEPMISKRIKIDKANDLTYVQEQASIKKRFSDALKGIDSDDEGDDYQRSDLLKRRKKTENEEKEEAEDYRKWLKGELEKLDSPKGGNSDELKFLRDYWNDPKLNEGEKFLRDYLLNRRYEEQTDESRIPSYDEIVHDSDEAGLSGDEEEINKTEEFEYKYNFRFEEPDQEFVKRYPRTVESSLRRTENKRKQKRDEKKERKEAEKSKKREEIQRLKALKRKEILEKLKQIEEITGEENLAFRDEDIEGDFDPDAHDRRMEQIFNEKYYQAEDDEEKPVFPYDEELDAADVKPFCPSDDDESEEMDTLSATASLSKNDNKSNEATSSSSKLSKKTNMINELIDASRGKRQNKKKSSLFLEALERNKPKFESATHKSFQEYFDEYYKLDFEDIIGDLPCRFKYRNVTPNDFGLSFTEILQAPDRELNQWASLKKTYQHRSIEEEKYEVDAYRKKSSNMRLKKKILPTIFAPANDEEESNDDDSPKPTEATEDKKKKKRRRSKKKKSRVSNDDDTPKPTEANEDNETNKVSDDDVSKPTKEAKDGKKKKKKNTSKVSHDDTLVEEKGDRQENKRKKNASKISHNEAPKLIEEHEDKHKNKKTKKNSSDRKFKKPPEIDIDDERLKAYGINPTKYKKQLKYGNKS